MKKIWSMAAIMILSVFALGACAESEAGDMEFNFPGMEWGMAWEEVMDAGGIDEKDIADDRSVSYQYSSNYGVEGYEVFGEKSAWTDFTLADLGSGTQGLVLITVEYPDDADMDHVLEEMEKAYGSPIPKLTEYEQSSPFEENSLYAKEYEESDSFKIWAGTSVGEAVPKEQETEYKSRWQEKIYPTEETSSTFQLGLNDGQWDEFAENARLVRIFWTKKGNGIVADSNKIYFNAHNDQVLQEITRRIADQQE